MEKVTAAIIEMHGKILIAKRKKGTSLAHKWEFPGGKLERSETPEQCLKRELHEEFGVEAEVGDFFCSSSTEYENKQIELLAYRASIVRGELSLHAHDEVRWVHIDEMDEYDFAEPDILIIEKLREKHRRLKGTEEKPEIG